MFIIYSHVKLRQNAKCTQLVNESPNLNSDHQILLPVLLPNTISCFLGMGVVIVCVSPFKKKK